MESVPFLREIASILLQSGTYDLTETCLVFPNKRARLYLGKYLGDLAHEPVWAPRYLTISELMEEVSGYLYADRLTLVFELYKVYTEVSGSGESFDTFYPYSETLLADFDEIDKYLVDANDLFRNLAGLKSLEGRFNYLTEEQVALIRRFWSTFDPENISGGQKTFLSLWELMPAVYEGLRMQLHQQQLAYEGMAYRKAVENIYENHAITGLNSGKYLFVGFNALNKCEEKLFRYLKNLGRAEFFWDYDTWYTNNDMHEAGLFIRRNLKDFPQVIPVARENLLKNNKQIFFVPVASNTGQAEILPAVFNTLGIGGEHEKERTALVLADESLLIPVLYAIPDSVSELNVTMGYPLAGSSILNLVDSLYELERNSRKGHQGNHAWYFKDVLAILDHPLLQSHYAGISGTVRQKVTERNLIFLQESDIFSGDGKDLIFSEHNNTVTVVQYLSDVVAMIMRQKPLPEEVRESFDQVKVEILFQVYTFLIRLNDLILSQGIVPGRDILFRFIRKMIRNMHLPFSGEPLSGLQVLGLLETRTLDFDNVILLSANEGILPRNTDKPSFIPYSLRSGFGLPNPEHHDAIYAYYFYRLIQRAKKVALVYDCSTGGLRTGERSRFLHQIYYEMPLTVDEINIASPIARIPVKPVVVAKTGRVAESLSRYKTGNGKYLSPSAINEFLNCGLKFCFHHLLELPQPEEVTEDIDARMLGNLLHRTMKIIYSGFGSSLVTESRLEPYLKDGQLINTALDKAFMEELYGNNEMKGDRKIEGYNLIIRQVIHTYVRQLIKADLASGPFAIVSLEDKHITSLPVSFSGKQLDLQIGGVIDRIDLRQGHYVIIDYKTGGVKNSFSTIESLFRSEKQQRNDAVFQVLLYAHIFERLNPGSNIIPGLYFVRGSHSEDFSYLIKHGAKRDNIAAYASVKDEFESLLQQCLSEMFDLHVPFIQTSNPKVCAFCSYSPICRR